MKMQQPVVAKDAQVARPKYEKPRIQEMSEKQVLSTFQITQAMSTWWSSC